MVKEALASNWLPLNSVPVVIGAGFGQVMVGVALSTSIVVKAETVV